MQSKSPKKPSFSVTKSLKNESFETTGYSGFTWKMSDLSFLDHETDAALADTLTSSAVAFEGCQFFPLDPSRCEELATEAKKLTSEASLPKYWDSLQEIGGAKIGFRPTRRNSILLCAA